MANHRSVRTTIIGTIAVLVAATCWSFSGIFVNLVISESQISAISLAFWRDLTTFALFLPLAYFSDKSRLKIQRPDWPKIAGMGLFLGISHANLNLSYQLNGAAITTILQTIMPAIVLVVARIIWKEPLTRLKLFSMALVTTGAVLVSGVIRIGALDVTLFSVTVGFLVPILYAGWSLFGKALSNRYSPVGMLTWVFGIAALILMPFQLTSANSTFPLVSFWALLWFAGMVIISTIMGFFIFTFALKRISVGIASIVVMSEVAFAILFANLFLGETIDRIEIAGTMAVVAGVLILLAPGVKSDPEPNPSK